MKREFSKEFKRDAVSLVVDQGYSCVEAASSLDIHPALLSRWVREHTEEEDGGDAFRGKGKLRLEQEEIRQLREEVKYSFIAQNKKTWPVDVMSRLMGINRNSYYSYQRRQKNRPEDPEHQEKLDWIKKVAEGSQYTYGGRRMRKACNVAGPDRAYVSDITYIHTQEGWLYLAVVIDLFSRKVVGWSMSSRMKATLVCDAMKIAIWQRKPKRGLIVHSDRGSQYASHEYRKLLKMYGYVGSMSRKDNCWDNAVAESFFGSLKQEQVQWRHYLTRYAAQQDVLNYISMFYNCYRLHSYLGYMNPNQFEREWGKMKKIA